MSLSSDQRGGGIRPDPSCVSSFGNPRIVTSSGMGPAQALRQGSLSCSPDPDGPVGPALDVAVLKLRVRAWIMFSAKLCLIGNK